MQQVIEKEVSLPNVSILLARIQWGSVTEFRPTVEGYYICQRLSDNHSPLRFDNLAVGEAFPSVRSLGLLPPSFSVRALPPESPFRAINCVFDKDFFENTTEIDPRWNEDPTAFMDIRNKRLATMMQQIYTELENPAFGTELVIEAASTMILVEMARHVRDRQGILRIDDGPVRGGLSPWQLRRIRDRIEASLELGYPGVGELSTLCGVSQFHLMRAFKVSTGMPVYKYITEERLKAARQLLLGETFSICEISERLGFSSPAYFSTAFRRHTGVTPSEFRRRVRVSPKALTVRNPTTCRD